MNTQYYRVLRQGERYVAGQDKIVIGDDIEPLNHNGNVNAPPRKHNYLLRPVQVDEWIEYAKQKPTSKDGDVVDVYDGKRVTAYLHDSVPSTVTHWRRITPPTPITRPVIVKDGSGSEYPVEPQKDGSLKVGCAKIPKKDLQEIVKQWEAATGETIK